MLYEVITSHLTGMTMNIGVIGAGSWGTTLANLLAKKGYSVTLWAYEKELVARMRENGVNDLYLPDFTLSPNMRFTADLKEAAKDKDLLLLVPPSQVMRRVMEQAADYIREGTLIVSASKGIENDTLQIMSEVLA